MGTVTEQTENKGYEIVPARTYAQGVAKLRAEGEQPKTFKQNIEARVIAYENGDRSLVNTWLDSCTGMAYKAGTTKFKIIPRCNDLLTIPEVFYQYFLPIIYDNISAPELDSSNGSYNRLLEESEVENHEGWREALENDVALLKVYRDIIFKDFKKERAMNLYVRQDTKQDELRALFVDDLDGDSNAGGDYLNNLGSFLRGSPVVSAAGARVENEGASKQKETSVYEITSDKEEGQ